METGASFGVLQILYLAEWPVVDLSFDPRHKMANNGWPYCLKDALMGLMKTTGTIYSHDNLDKKKYRGWVSYKMPTHWGRARQYSLPLPFLSLYSPANRSTSLRILSLIQRVCVFFYGSRCNKRSNWHTVWLDRCPHKKKIHRSAKASNKEGFWNVFITVNNRSQPAHPAM